MLDRTTPVVFAVLVLSAGGLSAQQLAQIGPEPAPHARAAQVRPTLEVARTAGAIRIDGDLGDAGWAGAAVADGFSEFQPREGVPARSPTEALVTYDADNLYVAFRVRDDPRALRVTLQDRDAVWDDDWVMVVLDTYGDNSWAYMIGANPIGVQLDARFSNASGDDASFDVIYRSAGRVTEDGYQVELAIPFASLRFPDAPQQDWKLQFVRSHPRASRHLYSWAALSQNNNCVLCQSGSLLGIRGVEPGGQLELLPAVVAGQRGALTDGADPGSYRSADPSAEFSLGIRYPFKSGWTAEATYNPDFSQIESDASQIDVNSTFALFFPERRPFFQEGGDLFNTWVNAVHTRSINDPVAAGKLIGRQGNLALGYIGAVDEHSPLIIPLEEASVVLQNGRSVSNILRARQMFGSGSSVGGLITDRRFTGGGSGSTVGADLLLRLSELWQLEAQVVGSYTREPSEAGPTAGLDGATFGDAAHTATFDGESFAGRASYVSLERNARGWNFDADYWDATPTYRADNGFQGQNDFRRVILFNGYGIHPDKGLVDQVFVGNRNGQTWNFDGESKNRFAAVFAETRLKGQTRIGAELVWEEERYAGILFEDMVGFGIGLGSDFSEMFGFNLSYGMGESIHRPTASPGRNRNARASVTFKPVRNLIIGPSLRWARMEGEDGIMLFEGYIARNRLDYQVTRRFSARVVTEWNDFRRQLSVEPLLVYRINPLSVAYLGATGGYREFDDPQYDLERTSRQYFLKVQYLLRP
ncbi:MAG TPA: sugar-binding protein [Longimicrobiales bacterium]|nr:sugar-binding protein [Longimicrobiales bacterium]